jgi:Tol biopolymer transport system component
LLALLLVGDGEGLATQRPPTPTPIQLSGIRITAENADRVTRLARWGKGPIDKIAWSPDSKIIAVASSYGVCFYNAETVRQVVFTERHVFIEISVWVSQVAFSPDGSLVASGSRDKTVRLWRVSDGSLLRTLKGHTDNVFSVAFSPDGKRLASGSRDKTVRLWQVSDGSLLRTLEHTADVHSVAFSPDGESLASGSDDKTVRLWRVSDGSLLRTLKGHTDNVISVAFSPDGKRLASGSADSTVRLWGVAP